MLSEKDERWNRFISDVCMRDVSSLIFRKRLSYAFGMEQLIYKPIYMLPFVLEELSGQ